MLDLRLLRRLLGGCSAPRGPEVLRTTQMSRFYSGYDATRPAAMSEGPARLPGG